MDNSVCMYYFAKLNAFRDGEGEFIYNIFEFITPFQLQMFRQERVDIFVPHRTIPNFFVELLYFDEEAQEAYEFIDVGDDLERIERYEKNKFYGCFV